MPVKGSSTQRGYDEAHKRERLKWVPRVKAGGVRCHKAGCGKPIASNEPWDLGHVDGTIRTKYPRWTGPEHRACNRNTAAQRKAQTRPSALSVFDAKPFDTGDAIGA